MWLVERESNVVNSKWVFSWECSAAGVALELVPTSVLMLGSSTFQGTVGHPKDNTLEQLSSCLGNGSLCKAQVVMLGVC